MSHARDVPTPVNWELETESHELVTRWKALEQRSPHLTQREGAHELGVEEVELILALAIVSSSERRERRLRVCGDVREHPSPLSARRVAGKRR